MNPKAVIILIVVLALAASALFLLPSGPPPRIEDEEDEPGPLFTEQKLGPSIAVLRIFSSSGRQPDLVVVKKNGRWWVSEPHLFPAHRPTVETLLTTLARMQATPVSIEAPEGPANEFHSRRLTVEYMDRPPESVHLGERAGAGLARVSLDYGAEIFETDVDLHDYFDAFDPSSFYARKVLTPIMPDVERIDFATIDGQSTLVQQADGWFIGDEENPERALAQNLPDAAGVEQVFTLVDLLELSNPQPTGTPLSAYGLKEPLASIALGPIHDAPAQADNAMTISLGVPANPEDTQRYVGVIYDSATPPAVFTAPTKYALLLAQDATTFRDPRIFTTPTTLIKRIALTSGDSANQSLKLIEVNQLLFFSQRLSQPSTLDPAKLAAMLHGLQEARAIEYVALEGLSAERIEEVAIVPKLEGEQETFEVLTDPESKLDEPTVLVRRGDEPVALRVPRASVAGLLDPMSLVAEDGE